MCSVHISCEYIYIYFSLRTWPSSAGQHELPIFGTLSSWECCSKEFAEISSGNVFLTSFSCGRHVCECHLLTVFCSGLVSDTSGFEEQISHSEQPFWSRATWTWFYSKTMCKRILAMTFVDKIDAWGSEEKKHGPEHWLTRLFLKLHRPIDDIVIKSRSPGTKHQKKHV